MIPVPLAVDGWTFGRFVDEIGERFAAMPAIIASDHTFSTTELRRWTYAEMMRDVHALQWGLIEAGVRPGERVGVMLSSFPEWVLYLFAVTRLGAIFLPINTRFRSRELQHVLSHSASSTLIAMERYLGHDYAATIAEIRERLPGLRTIIAVRGAPHPAALDTAEVLDRGSELLASRGIPPLAADPHETALLFYTSGTTSFPKGVPLTHSNLLPHSVRTGELLELEPGEKVLTFYPFFGISGGANKVLSTFGSGAALVFQDAFRAEEACDLLESESCSVIHGVDVHVRELVAEQKRRVILSANASTAPESVRTELVEACPELGRRVRTLERRATIAFTGGIDEPLAREMGDVLGIRRFSHPYGMTETNPMILRNQLDDPFEAAVRAGGRIAPNVEVRVVDPETGADRAAGEEGEIVVRGPTVMKGYYNDPEATAAAFRGGWFHSGDLGVRTEEGFIFYVGRLKDMVKVGGFNVAPQEIESFLGTHADIHDVAVTSVPDPRLGEVAVAFVQLKPGASVSSESLIAWCRENLANFKVPRAVYFVDALPYHTAAHGAKLQRHVLREWAKERAAGPS